MNETAPPAADLPPDPSTAVPSLAGEYRRRRDRRERPRRRALFAAVVVGPVILAVYYGVHAPGPGALAAENPSLPLPHVYLDSVTLGTPAVQNVTCGDGATVKTELVPWVNASVEPTTHQVFLEITELLDGDVDGGSAPNPTVTSSSVCAGAAPTVTPSWYVVLRSPNGTNVAVFSYSSNWVILNQASSELGIANGSSLILVANPSLAGLTFGLCALGVTEYLSLWTCAQL
jgi:hypothetical protein